MRVGRLRIGGLRKGRLRIGRLRTGRLRIERLRIGRCSILECMDQKVPKCIRPCARQTHENRALSRSIDTGMVQSSSLY